MDVSLIKDIKEKAFALGEELTATRRHLHAHPEPSWREVETTRLVADRLAEIGFQNIDIGVGDIEGLDPENTRKTGVVADLRGGGGMCVALRADMDALTVTEQNEDLPYRSTVDGVAHACGHDGHVSALLGTAKVLYSMKDRLPGTVRFIFQPGEEHGIHSGARAMIRKGALKGVDAITGMHLWSHVPAGRVHWRGGPVMGSVDGWHVEFQGRGGHGGMPQDAVDPTVMAASFILAAQTLISRETAPLESGVVSIGRLHSGQVINVIPQTAELTGNVRTFDVKVRDRLRDGLKRVAEGIAATYRGSAEMRYTEFYPNPVNNDKRLAELFRDTAVRIVGAEKVEESPMMMTAEDFGFYQQEVPGNFFFLGCGNAEKGITAPHHAAGFNIDDDVLPTAVALMSAAAWAMLDNPSAK